MQRTETHGEARAQAGRLAGGALAGKLVIIDAGATGLDKNPKIVETAAVDTGGRVSDGYPGQPRRAHTAGGHRGQPHNQP